MSTDPVRATRAVVNTWAARSRATGYLLYVSSIVLFVIGFAGDFPSWIATTIIVCLIVGSVFLAPAIILGYAVKAAEREDRAAGR